jgi:hypothetical protein
MVRFRSVILGLRSIKVSFRALKGGSGCLVPSFGVADFLHEPAAFCDGILSFGLVPVAFIGVHPGRCTIAGIVGRGCSVEGVLHALEGGLLLAVQIVDA